MKTTIENGILTHRMYWVNNPVSPAAYNEIATWVRKSKCYSVMSSSRRTAFKATVAAAGRHTDISFDQALSIRNVVLKDKIIRSHPRMNSQIAEIAKKYQDGASILDLSSKYDFPPVNLLRGIFLHLGMSKHLVYDIFANKINSTELVGRNMEQFRLAEENDAESIINQNRIATLAQNNENLFIAYFQALGIGIKTQNQLVEEQTAEFGRAVITPDILFTDVVYINGERVHWIDYKDYIGSNISFLYRSNAEQAARYAKHWGPGALCYRRSFVSSLKIPGAILLDASATKIKFGDLD